MKKILLSSIAIAALISVNSASASHHMNYKMDYKHEAVMPCSTWTGFYVGLNAGGAWGTQNIQLTGDPVMQAAINAGLIPSTLADNPSGFVGGAQLGYNYQISQALLGIETDIQYANIRAKESTSPLLVINGTSTPGFTSTFEQKVNYIGTLRGRLGWIPIDPVLVYVTGGLAYGERKISGTIAAPNCATGFCSSASTSKTSAGWTAGAGVEYMFQKNWSVRAEYLYYDLGSMTTTLTDAVLAPTFPGLFVNASTAFRGNWVRAAVNYNFS